MARQSRLLVGLTSLVAIAVLGGCVASGPTGSAFASAPSAIASGQTSATAPAPAASPAASASTTAASPTQVALDVDVGGRTLHVFCIGDAPSGVPTVIGEGGLEGDSRTWNAIFYEVAARTRICAYDRAGLNQSQPAPEASRTMQDSVDDFAKLIAAAKLEGPFVFVGHSSGAWNVALFASQHPDEVAGVVLADPRGPHVSGAWLKALPAKATGEPEAVRLNREELTVFETDPSLNEEHVDLRASQAEANAVLDPKAPLFGDHPLVVMSAAHTPDSWSDLPDALRTTFDRIWFDGQKALLKESTRSEFETIDDSDHDLPGMRPDAVSAAILRVLDEVGS